MGGGKGGGGGDIAANSMNFQIMQWAIDQQNQQTQIAKQDEINAQNIAMQKENLAWQKESWEKTREDTRNFQNQQQANWNQQRQPEQVISTVGNVNTELAKKSTSGGQQEGRVKTLYSDPKARTRGKRVVLGGSDQNNETVFKRVLGE
jgi:hypothetical protein